MNLGAAWTNFWNVITNGNAGLGVFLAIVGIGIIAWYLGMWIWQKRRGGGAGGGRFPTGAVVLGLILAGPTITLPVLLGIIDAIAVIGINIVNAILRIL